MYVVTFATTRYLCYRKVVIIVASYQRLLSRLFLYFSSINAEILCDAVNANPRDTEALVELNLVTVVAQKRISRAARMTHHRRGEIVIIESFDVFVPFRDRAYRRSRY